MKSPKCQLSNDIRFSTQTQGMTKIWSKEKKSQRGGDFFLSLTVYLINKECFVRMYKLKISIFEMLIAK